jgi:PAS domain S-box-containing protein
MSEREATAPGWMGDGAGVDGRDDGGAPASGDGGARAEPRGRWSSWFGTVRAQLTLVILLAAAPGFVFLFLHGASSRDDARERAADQAVRIARAAAAEQGRRLAAASHVLDVLTQDLADAGRDHAACEALLRTHLERDAGLTALVVAAPDAALVAAAVRPGWHAPSLLDAPWFLRAVATRRPSVGEIELAPGGELVHCCARPVLDAAGAVVAVAVASLDLTSVGEVAAQAQVPDGSRLLWLDARDDVIAQRPAAPSVVGERFPSGDALKAAFASDEGTTVAPGPDGSRHIVGCARLYGTGGGGGRAVFLIPEAVALRDVNTALYRAVGWMTAVGLLALLGAGRLAERQVLVPLDRLSRAAERLRAGDTTARAGPPYRSGEVGHLQWAFDGMADSLERDRREFAAAERKYRALVEELPAVLYVLRVRPQGEVQELVYVSPQVRSLGFDPAELTDGRRRWIDTVHVDDRRVVMDAVETTVQTGQPFDLEHRVDSRDGRTRWLRNTGALVRDAGGGPMCIRGFAVDVTERKVLEEQLQRSQKLEAIGQLAAGVAHDFNNLLTVILGYTHLLDRMAENDTNLRGQLHEIQKAGDRAAVLTHRLLAFTRKREAAPQVLDLRASVAELEQMVTRLLGPRIEVKIVTDSGAGLVLADPGHVDQILMNLAVNARDAMPNGGRLVVEVYDRGPRRAQPGVLPGPYVCVSVTDTGCGMDAATQRRVFEPFFTTKAEGKGTGLGLATVYALVQQSGGFVAFESEVGRGTTFRVYLPRVAHPLERPPCTTDERDEVLPPGSGTVLVVDDEDAVRALACAALTDRGYQVLETARGDDALVLAELHEGPLAALVTDIGLPGMDGRELASRLRAIRPGTPVLLMSGYAETVVRDGCDVDDAAFVAKPFTPRDLVRTLRDLLETRALPASEAPESATAA